MPARAAGAFGRKYCGNSSMTLVLELLGEAFCVLAEPLFEWLVGACVGIWQAAVEVVRYRRLERDEKSRKQQK